MHVRELAPGLWRWTAFHPDWQPGASWAREVGCVYLETAGWVILVDPLVPDEAEARETFLAHLDADVARNAKPVALLLTNAWHERSAGELAARYEAAVWLHERVAAQLETPVSNPFSAGDVLPGGAIAVDALPADETLFWFPEHRALVAGDTLLGDDDGGLRVSPDGLDAATETDLKVALRGLLDLPVELVLVSHGEPVLEDGSAALARALSE